MKTRIENLDLLRGLAAVAIVVFHFQRFLGVAHAGYAFVAVDMFFALSGIVLTLKYTDAIVDGMGPLEFAGARLRRLYPMVFIVGACIVAMNLAKVPAGTHMVATTTDAWTVLLVTPLPRIPTGAFPPNPPMWSFWAELAANAVWFAVLKAGRRWMLPLGIASLVATVAIALRMNTLNFGWEDGALFRLASLARALAWFSVGYAIAMRACSVRVAVAVFLTVLLSLVITAHTWHGATGAHELLGAAVSVAVLNLVYRLPPASSALAFVGRYLGMASFPLYLVHSPAGRLLPYFDRLPPWVALLAVVGTATVLTTVANEASVKLVNRAYKNWYGARLASS